MQPRARRLANSSRTALSAQASYSPRVATWFDHGHLAREGNWKRQYRLRHNWSKGLCRVTEVEFPEPTCPPTLVRLCAGVVFTADSIYGLRAWTAKDPARCLASLPLLSPPSLLPVTPTALAVSQVHTKVEISVGLENGHFSVFLLDLQTCQLDLQSSHAGCHGAITAMDLSSSYLLVVSQYRNLKLYKLHPFSHQTEAAETTEPLQLASLEADNMLAPMTVSLRVLSFDILATIVYSFFHIGCGWSLGIQELRLGKNGQQLDSRLTTTVDSQYGVRPLSGSQCRKQQRSAADLDNSRSGTPSILHQQPPTSLSYSHPYLLTSHADNTLTMYLVVSTFDNLFVQGGRRLWGHTSSVSTVQVTKRGKAVSVSSRGNEIRIWELETAISSLGTRNTLKEDHGIPLTTDNKRGPESESPRTLSQSLDSTDLEANFQALSRTQCCVGFDEERVLLLREKSVGGQLLECYDFT